MPPTAKDTEIEMEDYAEKTGLIEENEKVTTEIQEKDEGDIIVKQNIIKNWISQKIAKLGVLKDRNVLISCGLYPLLSSFPPFL